MKEGDGGEKEEEVEVEEEGGGGMWAACRRPRREERVEEGVGVDFCVRIVRRAVQVRHLFPPLPVFFFDHEK